MKCSLKKRFLCTLGNLRFWIALGMTGTAIIGVPFFNNLLAEPFPMGEFSSHTAMQSRFTYPDYFFYGILGVSVVFLTLMIIKCCERDTASGCRCAKKEK